MNLMKSENLTRVYHMTKFALKKKAPTIFVAAGIAGTIGATVMACKATPRAIAIVEEHHKTIDAINEAVDISKEKEGVDYDKKEAAKERVNTYIQTSAKLAAVYGPAVVLGTISIACIFTSHKMMLKRNTQLAAAYAAIDKGFKEYRDRVKKRFGDDVEREVLCNIEKKEVEEVVTDEKTGKTKTVKKVVDYISSDEPASPYSFVYHEGNIGYTNNPKLNKMFLELQQEYANEKLKAQGYLLLNDVYTMLGHPITKAGFVVGWIYKKDNEFGDNMVDFGIHGANESARLFREGVEPAILLDFNVDGNIMNHFS